MNYLQNKILFQESCYLDGHWVQADNHQTMEIINPFDHTVLGRVPTCGGEETRRAIGAAERALQEWRKLSAMQRSAYLLTWAKLIDENKQDLAILITLEQGKPLAESVSEIEYGNAYIKWFAEEGRRVYGDIIPSSKSGQRLLVIKQPIGVVAAITPWNFPMAMIARKCAPALAAGCTLVIKPAEETPFSALALAVLAAEAGIPAGVINIITGAPAAVGHEMATHPVVRKISFTGSTVVGKLLMQQAASTVKKIALELGGNAPFIVFEDADLKAAIQGTLECKFRNSGQTCVSANRILVHDKIYEIFAKQLVLAVQTLAMGNGLNPGVQQGPLINSRAVEKVEAHLSDAIAKGATVLCGGKLLIPGKLFFMPTVVINMNEKMRMAKEEIFGPVAALYKFSTEEEAVHMANNTELGLASYFYTRDLNRIWRVSEALEYGMVGINAGVISTEVAPFGGIKESGIGREGSKYGIDEYLETKYLCLE